MYYLEVLFVFGREQLQTFYGPFSSPKKRNRFKEWLEEHERISYEKSLELKREGVPEDEALSGILDPAHVKHLAHDGPLPTGDWQKLPTEFPSVFYWQREAQVLLFAKRLLPKRD